MSELPQAIALHRAGRLPEAEAIYRRMLAHEPEHAEVLHLLGLVACQDGRLREAAELMGRAAARMPEHGEFQLSLGEVQRRMGRLAEAIGTFKRAEALAPGNAMAPYNLAVALEQAGAAEAAIAAHGRALELQPAFPEALHKLGLLFHQAQRNEEAADCLRRAIALRPGHAEAENNLGLVLWQLHQHAAALAAFTRAAHLAPKFAHAHTNRAFALRKLGNHFGAIGAFQEAAALDPASADIQRHLAIVLMEIGHLDAAIAAGRRAVALAPDRAQTRHALGVVLAAAARADPPKRSEAVAAYRQALALSPGMREWEFELQVLQGQTPTTAPDSCIQLLFDEYAPRFEQHLVKGLNYRVPQHLLAAVEQAWQQQHLPAQNLDVLDLGSGTGLCGELFRPRARTITGIDLSPNMIALARNRRDPAGKPCYDRLLNAHLLPGLQQFTSAFDLILAADVFIYVGALDQVFPAAAAALRPGGLLAFSLERHDGEGFIFHLRFAHSLAYIRTLAAASGFTEITAQPCHLRDDVPPGWLVILQSLP